MLRNLSHPNIVRYGSHLAVATTSHLSNRYRGIQYDEGAREVNILLEYAPFDLQRLVNTRGQFHEYTVAFLMKQVRMVLWRSWSCFGLMCM
jgi:hypothetical protein